jgi:hypothetical protein
MRNNKTTASAPLRLNEVSWILEQQFKAGVEEKPAKKPAVKKARKKK